MEASFEPGHIAVRGGGRRFVVLRRPRSAARACVLHVPAFAEEMNKSRRMVAMTARALAESGVAVATLDLAGCGDSDGEFADATWEQWIDDVVDAADWLVREGRAPLWLWGERAGALLAVDAARRIDAAVGLVFWQPATAGALLLQQFLRVRTAGALQGAAAARAKEGVGALRAQLAAGAMLEVAGYALSPVLAAGLDAAALTPTATPGRVAWLEVSARADATLLPASQSAIAQWRAAGHEVHAEVVAGPAFWQTTEIEDAPALVEATLAVFASPCTA